MKNLDTTSRITRSIHRLATGLLVGLAAAATLGACSLSDPPKKRPSVKKSPATAEEPAPEASGTTTTEAAPVPAASAAIKAQPTPEGQLRGVRTIQRAPDLKRAPIALQPRMKLKKVDGLQIKMKDPEANGSPVPIDDKAAPAPSADADKPE